MTATLVGVSAWLVVLAKWRNLRHLGLFVTLVASILLAIAGMTLYVPVGPLVPALQSYWLVIHVGAASIASGIFLVGFVAAAMHLIRLGHDQGKRNFPYSLGERLPQADVLERVTFRVHAFAFPIWTFGVIAGAIWAEAAWGRYWGWDPKEIWSFIAWVVYAGYLHARSTPSVSRRITSWIAIAGWADDAGQPVRRQPRRRRPALLRRRLTALRVASALVRAAPRPGGRMRLAVLWCWLGPGPCRSCGDPEPGPHSHDPAPSRSSFGAPAPLPGKERTPSITEVGRTATQLPG